jgi:hypothetical protein
MKSVDLIVSKLLPRKLGCNVLIYPNTKKGWDLVCIDWGFWGRDC